MWMSLQWHSLKVKEQCGSAIWIAPSKNMMAQVIIFLKKKQFWENQKYYWNCDICQCHLGLYFVKVSNLQQQINIVRLFVIITYFNFEKIDATLFITLEIILETRNSIVVYVSILLTPKKRSFWNDLSYLSATKYQKWWTPVVHHFFFYLNFISYWRDF